MLGQGSPTGRFRFFLILTVIAFGATVRCLSSAETGESSVPVRLNISWSTDGAHSWSGELRVEGGFFWNSVPLGGEQDASVTFLRAEENAGRIVFKTPNPVPFCGVQTTVVAPLDASLTVSMESVSGQRLTRTFTPGQFLAGPVQVPFDMKENGLLIERAAGDEIPLSVSRLGDDRRTADDQQLFASMVFDPNETLLVGIFTKYLPKTDRPARLVFSLRAAGSNETLRSEAFDLTDQMLAERPRLDVPISLDNVRGPFDLEIDLIASSAQKGRFPLLPSAKDSSTVLARRTLQGVVVPSSPLAEPTDDEGPADHRDRLLETVDPTNPSWWKIFARRPFFNESEPKEPQTGSANLTSEVRGQQPDASPAKPGRSSDFLNMWRISELQTRVKPLKIEYPWGQWDKFWQHPLGSGNLSPLDADDPRKDGFVSLSPSSEPDGVSWEAYTIPIREPGKPHLLEIEYLPDVPQTLGISILEPSVSGGLFPRSLDNGIFVSDEPLSDRIANRVLKSQILFWPKTKTPMILMTNQQPDRPACYGRIRIYRAKEEFVPNKIETRFGRSLSAVMTRPTLCDQFLAESRPSPVGALGAQDWTTFYQAATRLTDYLIAAGYDSLTLSAAADGSTLYPSALLRPNPKFDSGVFLTRGEDPVRKDVLELLFRLFDRRKLSLTPLLDFNAPISALEESSAAHLPAAAEGLYWVGPDGAVRVEERENGSVFAGYNLFHPATREAIFLALDELAVRYAAHPSFAGLAIDLSEEGFARLPDDVYYGMDDRTFRLFVEQSRLAERIAPERIEKFREVLSASDPDRCRRRALFIRDDCRQMWLDWRAESVFAFYQEAQDRLRRRRSDLRLTLFSESMADTCTVSTAMTDTATRDAERRSAFLRAGFDPQRFASQNGPTFLRCGQVVGDRRWAERAETLDRERPESIRLFTAESTDGESVCPGVFFHHSARPRGISSFDAVSPFCPTLTQVAVRAVPADFENRRRFAHQLAVCETLSMADGGEMIPMGQEESLWEWMSVWRRLPVRPFSTWRPAPSADDASTPPQMPTDPVVFRTLRTDRDYWGYFVNDAPFHCSVNIAIRFAPEAKVEIFVGGRTLHKPETTGGKFRWDVSLRPYDLVAFRITDPQAELNKIEVTRPEDICGPDRRLEKCFDEFAARVLLAEKGVEISLDEPSGRSNAGGSAGGGSAGGEGDSASDPKKSPSLLGLDIPKVNLLRGRFGSNEEKTDLQPPARESESPAEALFRGWTRHGTEQFQATADSIHAAPASTRQPSEEPLEVRSSLKLVSVGTVGGISSRPFDPPKSGRLFAAVTFGLPSGDADPPLRVSLVGRLDGAPWRRQLDIGPLLRSRTQAQPNVAAQSSDGVLWTREILLFDDLPTEGLEDVSIHFDLLSQGTLWLDDVRLYRSALTRVERDALLSTIHRGTESLAAGRYSEALAILNLPAARALAAEIPADSPLLAEQLREKSDSAEPQVVPEKVAQTQPAAEPEPPKKEKEKEKSFFRKILPW